VLDPKIFTHVGHRAASSWAVPHISSSINYNLPKSQINCLQQIQNCLALTVVKAPKSSRITPILRSVHWLKINERIEYKLLSLTYKVLTTSQFDYLQNLISVQFTGRTHSPLVTLAGSSVSSSLQITNRSFTYASPYLWNQLPSSFRHLILFTVLLFHLILRISPRHSHHLRSHHLLLPLPFTPNLKNSSLSQIPSYIVTLIPSGLTSVLN